MSRGQGLCAAALRRRVNDLVERELPRAPEGTDPAEYGWSLFDRLDPEEQAKIWAMLDATVQELLAETDPSWSFEDKHAALALRLGVEAPEDLPDPAAHGAPAEA